MIRLTLVAMLDIVNKTCLFSSSLQQHFLAPVPLLFSFLRNFRINLAQLL